MHTTEPSATDHPLLARLPVAAGAVCLRALRTEDIDDFVAYRSDPEVARAAGVIKGEACTDVIVERRPA